IIINNNELLIIRILVLDKKGGNCLKYKMVVKKKEAVIWGRAVDQGSSFPLFFSGAVFPLRTAPAL
ncbi:hypothetical protein, partial [Enterocloster clostridioformis]|uniref:hypothetical protein n=2 Tax=Enterocloster clostridioformis TaxID=1531 RepID=UPI00325B0AD1